MITPYQYLALAADVADEFLRCDEIDEVISQLAAHVAKFGFADIDDRLMQPTDAARISGRLLAMTRAKRIKLVAFVPATCKHERPTPIWSAA